jgi:thioesterase domain-containing protein
MNPSEIQNYLYEHIPLSAAMAIEVLEADDEHVCMQAPLLPNINHRSTVFGGSASAVAILAAWSLLNLRLRAAGLPCQLVIQRNSMEYRRPIASSFRAVARLVEPNSWERFHTTLVRRNKARIRVLAVLESEGHEAGFFEGVFVALLTKV